jgi:AraC-like DNA-binding protein
MIFVARRPCPEIESCVRLLWYCKAPALPHARERVLPRGEMQIILNLAGETLTECSGEQAGTACPLPPGIVVGPRGQYELVDTRDLAELLGIVFRPGGAAPFLREDASVFFERFISLEDVVPCRELRSVLRERTSPMRKLIAVEEWLVGGLGGRALRRRPLTVHALDLLRRHSVRETARALSVSERHLHQVMKAEVGLSPKLWSRVQRFQRALHGLHTGAEPRWEQLALECGFYDQSHFCNEFRAFSGIDPSTYTASPRLWPNHVPES